jgi:hypothetical protein
MEIKAEISICRVALAAFAFPGFIPIFSLSDSSDYGDK